jgi:hypothetical protein
VESGGNFEDYKLAYIRFISCHLFGPVNHGQTWTGWERSGEKGLIISDNQAFSCLIIKTFDNQTVSLKFPTLIRDRLLRYTVS